MSSKQKYFYIVAAVVILLLYGGLVFLFFQRSNEKPPANTTQQITQPPTPTQVKKSAFQEAQERGRSISPSDNQIRQRLITKAGKNGYIYQNKDFYVVYLSSNNIFQIRITSQNIEEAKQKALEWLQSQGLSQQGVCSLPVVFYISPKLLDVLQKEGKQFSPLPEGC